MSRADLRAVDELCRLVVAARRLGCRIHVEATDPELRDLLELAGVSTALTDPDLCTESYDANDDD